MKRLHNTDPKPEQIRAGRRRRAGTTTGKVRRRIRLSSAVGAAAGTSVIEPLPKIHPASYACLLGERASASAAGSRRMQGEDALVFQPVRRASNTVTARPDSTPTGGAHERTDQEKVLRMDRVARRAQGSFFLVCGDDWSGGRVGRRKISLISFQKFGEQCQRRRVGDADVGILARESFPCVEHHYVVSTRSSHQLHPPFGQLSRLLVGSP